MARKSASSSLIADRYVAALFPLAEKEGALDTVAAELAQLAGLLKDNVDFARLAVSPVIAPEKKAAIVETLLKGWKASPLTLRFATRAAAAGRLPALPAISRGFALRVAKSRNELGVTITSARPLSSADRSALTEALSNAAGKTVAARLEIDPSLIAGVVVTAGSKRMDYSLAGQIRRISTALSQESGAA